MKLVETPNKIYGQRQQFGEDELTKKFGKRFIDYRKQWVSACKCEFVPDYPLYLQIEHTTICNLKCIYCFHGIESLIKAYKKDLPHSLSIEMYQKILDESKQHNCPSISFHRYNEPLLIKDLDKRIQMASDAGFIDLLLVTNGTVMTKQLADMILNSAITKISFSLDSINQEIYSKLRRGGNVNTVIRNINYLASKREECGLKLPVIRVAALISKLNYEHLAEFKNYWDQRVDLVEFQHFRNMKGYTEHLIPPNSEPLKDFTCNQPWTKLLIRPNGDIMACCSMHAPELKLGNIETTTIYDAWHGPKMEQLRHDLKAGNFACNPACNICSNSICKVENGVV